jgi:hypothetical protein
VRVVPCAISLLLAASAALASDPPPATQPAVAPRDSILSEDVTSGPPNPHPPPYTLLRFNERYAYLADPRNRTDPLDPLKYIPLDPDDPSRYLTLGGEIRERFEHVDNPGFGTGGAPSSTDYLLQRIDLHADLHLDDRVRFFVQGISGFQFGQEGPSAPVNQDPLNLQQAFADLTLGDPSPEGPRLTLRTGRFEMSFGSGRLIALRQGPNVPFKFDGSEIIAADGDARLYAFLVRPGREEKYSFDGEDADQTFWGAYGTTPLGSSLGGPTGLSADLYYLGLRDQAARYATVSGTEVRHTFGTRLFGAVAGWDYDVEPVLQVGTLAGHDVLAWTLANDAGYTFASQPWSPRFGCKFDVASGDTSGRNAGAFGTFNPLFFKSPYFDDASVVRPSNLIDLHPNLQFAPLRDVVVTLGSDALWRFSSQDGIYGTAGNAELPAGASSNYIGTTAEAAVVYQFDRHVSWTVSYVHLFSSSAVRNSGGNDVDYFGTWITFVF